MHNKGEKMQNNRLTKTEKTIFTLLQHFAMHNEATIEDIAKTTGKDYTTILRTARKLERNGDIQLKRLERTAVKGKEKRIYTLTLYGLYAYFMFGLPVLGDAVFSSDNIRRVAVAHSDMLLAFKKWDKWVENGCEQTIISNFKSALRVSVFNLYFLIPLAYSTFPFPEQETNQRKAFDWTTLGFIFMYKPPNYIKEALGKHWDGLCKIFNIVENDYELRQAREEFFFFSETSYKEALKNLNEWRILFPKLCSK